MNHDPTDRLRTVTHTEGTAYWFLGTLVVIKSTGEDSDGAYTLVEQLARPGFSPPVHVHHAEDEAYYVIEGDVRFQVGARQFDVGRGGYVFLPKGSAHTFRVEGSAPARILVWVMPSGFEQFVQDIGVLAPKRELPPIEPLHPEVLERLAAASSKYQFSIVGPPL